jgi:hypothetical protein
VAGGRGPSVLAIAFTCNASEKPRFLSPFCK